MTFKINNCEWIIKELSQEQMKAELQKRYAREIEEEPSHSGRYLGLTFEDTQTIMLDEELPNDRKRKTLLHELTHCYINMYITHENKTYCEEDICNIVANSYYIITEIVNKYFEK